MTVYAVKTVEESPLKDTKYKDVIEGYIEFTTIHGVPHINKSHGVAKKSVWSLFLLGCLAGLLYNVTSLTLTYLSYPIDTKNQFIHSTDIVFPAVTVCNYNPVKQSLLTMSPRLQALLAKWGAEPNKKKRRRKRGTTCATYNDGAFSAQYCRFDSDVSYNTADGACTSQNSRLAYIDSAAKTAFIQAQFGGSGGWFGLRRYIGSSTTFKWGGTTALDYTNWSSSDVRMSSHNFAYISSSDSLRWKTDDQASGGDSDRSMQYFCETVNPVTVNCSTYHASDGLSSSEFCHYDSQVSYETASTQCAAQSARLAYVDTVDKTTFLQDQFGGSEGWIGLKADSENEFKWGGTILPSWNNWDNSNADPNDHAYAYIIQSGGTMKWQTDPENNDDSISQKTYYCEKFSYISTCHNYTLPDGCHYTELCYYGSQLPYEVASSICSEITAKLAYVDSPDKTALLQSKFASSEGWIGLKKETSSSSFMWGLTDPLSWTNWDTTGVDVASHRYGFILLANGEMRWQTDNRVNGDSSVSKSFYCEKVATLCTSHCASPLCSTALVQRGNEYVCFGTFDVSWGRYAGNTCSKKCDSCTKCAKLAKTNTSEITTLLAGYVTSDSWIDLHLQSGTYVWGDGQDISGYANWASSQPDTSKKYGYITPTGHWKVSDYMRSTLCEFSGYVQPITTTTLAPTTVEETTTIQPTAVEETTTTQPTTVEATTTIQATTVQDRTTIQSTTAEVTTTTQPTTLEETTTIQPTTADVTTTIQPTTLEETTTIQPTTPEETTPIQPTTVEETTTIQRTTVEETTTTQPTTVEATTTIQATTVEETTTFQSTTAEVTTTIQPTTVKETTMFQPTTAEVTTTIETTTLEETTTIQPTTAEVTTTIETTTLEETTSIQPTTLEETTTIQPTTVEETTTIQPITVEETTTIQPTTVEETTTFQPTIVAETTNVQPTTVGGRTTFQPTTVEYTTTTELTTTELTTVPHITTIEPITTSTSFETTSKSTTTISSSTTPVPTSSFDEREPPREDFLVESEILEILADTPVEEKKSMGYSYAEFIVDCNYQGKKCDERMNKCTGHHHVDFHVTHKEKNKINFGYFFDAVHGNCYVFNSGWNDNASLVFHTAYAGSKNGVSLTLNLVQPEYISSAGDAAGAVVVIHKQSTMPFPADQAILAPPGHITSIGIRQKSATRLGGVYNQCQDVSIRNFSRNVFEEHFPAVNYTIQTCEITCYQAHVISTCGCADPQYLMEGKAFGGGAPACDARNITEDDCMYGITKQYINDELNCDCPVPCEDMLYKHSISTSLWPPEKQMNSVAQEHASNINHIKSYPGYNISTDTILRENFLKVTVFMEELNYQHLAEKPKYTFVKFIADIGAVSGLWIGCSILTLVEFVESGLDIFILCLVKPCFWLHRKLKGNSSNGFNKRKISPTSSKLSYGGKEAITVTPASSESLNSPEYKISNYTGFMKMPVRKSTDSGSDAELHNSVRTSNASRLSANDINFDFCKSYSNQPSPTVGNNSPTDQKPTKTLRRLSTRRLLDSHNWQRNGRRKESQDTNYNKFVFGKLF